MGNVRGKGAGRSWAGNNHPAGVLWLNGKSKDLSIFEQKSGIEKARLKAFGSDCFVYSGGRLRRGKP